MAQEYNRFLIIQDSDFFVDTPDKLRALYQTIGQQALENPGAVVIFKLNEVPDGSGA